MTRFVIILALFSSTLFVAVIALIRVQPYHDDPLQAFLVPPSDCLFPCIMDIRPGVTTVREALDILRIHEWVAGLEVRNDDPDSVLDGVHWQWSGAQSDLIDSSIPGSLSLRNGIVTGVHIRTYISLGDLWLTHQPDRGGFTMLMRGTPNHFQHAAAYPDDHLIFFNRIPCSRRVAHTPDGRLLWQHTMEYNLVSWSIDYDEYALTRKLPDCD